MSTSSIFEYIVLSSLGHVPAVLRRVTQPISASMVVILADALVFVVKVESRVKDVGIRISSVWRRWLRLRLVHDRNFLPHL